MTFSEARDRAAQSFAQSTEVFLDEYQRRFGNIFNADSAAELLPDYKQSPETRATFGSAVHPTSRAIRDTAFERALRSNPDTVLFTSGGSAAGKSTIAPALASIGPVYDSTLSDSNGAQAAIARALQACSRVLVIHVRRPIGDSFAANLDRALSPNGCGRTVNITSLMRTHRGADETLAALLGCYAGNPRLEFRAYYNGRGIRPCPVDPAALAPRNYNGADDRLLQQLEAARPRLPVYIYRAALGQFGRGGP